MNMVKIMDANNEHLAQLLAIREAATQWPRCCDVWQDGIGGMHCRECAQKTFAMMWKIQKILGVGKDAKPLEAVKAALNAIPQRDLPPSRPRWSRE